MSKRHPVTIRIGEQGSDHIVIEPSAKTSSAAFSAEIFVHCAAWTGHFPAQFQLGELSRFGKDLEHLDQGLKCTAVLKPGEPYLVMTFADEGARKIHVMGAATHRPGSRTHLEFEFTISQSEVPHIVSGLLAADRMD